MNIQEINQYNCSTILDCLSDTTCQISLANNLNNSVDILNPLLFFDPSANFTFLYSNAETCFSPELSSFFKSFCLRLLPFCVIYSTIRFIISIFICSMLYPKFKKEINRRVERSNQARKKEIKNYYYVVLASLLNDFLNTVLSWWFFKGYQFYSTTSALFNCDPSSYSNNSSTMITYTNSTSMIDYLSLGQTTLAFKIVGPLWFITEAIAVGIQILATNILTYIDEYKSNNQEKFFNSHRRSAAIWAVLYLIIGIPMVSLSLFSNKDANNQLISLYSLRLYYKYFSTGTVAFWTAVSFFMAIIISEKLFIFLDFFWRKENKAEYHENKKAEFIQNLQSFFSITGNDRAELQSLFNTVDINSGIDSTKACDQICDIYTNEVSEHLKYIAKEYEDLTKQQKRIINVNYVVIIGIYYFLNTIGFLLVLISYVILDSLPLYLIGFGITCVATFIYELSHNFLLYKSFFAFVRNEVHDYQRPT